MITCKDVLKLNLDGMELMAGEKGLNRVVSWTYLCQTRPYADHMSRGNFAFIVVDYVSVSQTDRGSGVIDKENISVRVCQIAAVHSKRGLTLGGVAGH